ncbi:MAG: polyprenyl synthetase family protein [Bacteroidales bacterium]|jgi:geranylgeranyl diphosphate synthase type II|nr:polyprenyl synthetase family protein [Bacteroidales bacterium]
MYSLESIQHRISTAFTCTQFLNEPVKLYEPIIYTLDQGGKRIRPVLVLLACDLFGGDIEKAVFPAMGLEIFHNFTLLHDDIMDNAPLRRGKETVHKKWNDNTAILSGDTMFVLAYEYVAKTDPALLPDVLRLFNDTARKVCEGQQYDMNFETQTNITIDKYMMMIQLKTAVLIACSLKLGAIIALADPVDAENIYDFGIELGLAFQLQDDYLDAFGDTSVFGKEIGGDIITNKKTFLFLKAFEVAHEDDLIQLTHYFYSPEIPLTEKIFGVTRIYQKLRIDEYTRQEIELHFQQATRILDTLNVKEEFKEEIRGLSLGMVGRNK